MPSSTSGSRCGRGGDRPPLPHVGSRRPRRAGGGGARVRARGAARRRAPADRLARRAARLDVGGGPARLARLPARGGRPARRRDDGRPLPGADQLGLLDLPDDAAGARAQPARRLGPVARRSRRLQLARHDAVRLPRRHVPRGRMRRVGQRARLRPRSGQGRDVRRARRRRRRARAAGHTRRRPRREPGPARRRPRRAARVRASRPRRRRPDDPAGEVPGAGRPERRRAADAARRDRRGRRPRRLRDHRPARTGPGAPCRDDGRAAAAARVGHLTTAMADPSAIAEEQAALRRVATLVASGAEPAEIFHAVAEEAGRLLGARSSATIRYDGDVALTVGRWRDEAAGAGGGFEVGTRVPLAGSDGLTAVVARTGRSARIEDYGDVRGHAAEMMRKNGYRTAVAAPIVVGGRTWGLLLVASAAAGGLGADAERRLGDFAELVALGLESAEAREQLSASRLRILEAGLAERRRLERNLHDGAQQRLVSLALQLRVVEKQLEDAPEAARALVSGARAELDLAMRELRELARGLHPAVLTDRGLAAALESLASSAALPVEVTGTPAERLPEAVEAGAYFVVAESITNAVKHADATRIAVRLERAGSSLWIEIEDHRPGGADPAAGTGLRGLADRVEALGGRFAVSDRAGGGTVVSVELPV